METISRNGEKPRLQPGIEAKHSLPVRLSLIAQLVIVLICTSWKIKAVDAFVWRSSFVKSIGSSDYQQVPFLARPCTRRMRMRNTLSPDSDDSHEKDNQNEDKKEELNLSKIAELIDVSFVQACMQLAEGYVDVLKLMIASVQSAYKQRISPTVLIREIDAISQPSAGRPLLPEEVRLRNTWIQVVYVMLASLVASNSKEESTCYSFHLDPEIEERYGKVSGILIRRRALSDEFKGQELLSATRQLVLGDDDDNSSSSSQLEETILLQSLRVMWLTMTVVEEVQRCEGEFARMDAKMPPKPPIPGSFE